MKEVKGISLDFKDDGKPVSIVIQDPKKLGLDVTPDSTKSTIQDLEDQGPCPAAVESQGVSLWSVLKAWYYQQWPCDGFLNQVKDEL